MNDVYPPSSGEGADRIFTGTRKEPEAAAQSMLIDTWLKKIAAQDSQNSN
jgi:hypothetical protein